jgi:leucyl-tRNA synthetase
VRRPQFISANILGRQVACSQRGNAGRVQLARDASEADARAAALAVDGIQARLAAQAVRKFVYVPGQVVNRVVG